jgi:hypothetical protein
MSPPEDKADRMSVKKQGKGKTLNPATNLSKPKPDA